VPRIRSIKPELLRQPELALVSPAAISLYVGLMPHCDDYGHYRHHPRLIKADVYPMHPSTGVGEGQIEVWVDELLDAGLLCRYVVGERMYLHYPNWLEIQKVDKPSASLIPACPREPHRILARSSEPSGALDDPRELSRALSPRARAQDSSGTDQGQDQGQDQELPTVETTSLPSAPVTAQQIIGAYIDRYGKPSKPIVGQLAKQLKQALEDGIDLEHVLGGLEDWHGRDQHPSTLASFIDVRRRGGQPRAAGRVARGRQQLIDTHHALEAWAKEAQDGRVGVDPDRRPAQRELPRPAG